MVQDIRLDPDAILKQLKTEDSKSPKGKLKIFFGYAAGVGKTYTMLQAANNLVRQGVDVVAGYVEPHNRPDTAALFDALPKIEKKQLAHGEIFVYELDLDAALARHPRVILVDELAHTNAPGCRHAKRHQDVAELLAAGIDVYTTVNVQHLESLNDTVATITGIRVRERIPDSVFDAAAQVELVDIEPAELIDRLEAGKIYSKPQATLALESFFDKKNLTALREIALRRCADRVNLLVEKSRQASHLDFSTGEHILVCLSPSPTNARIIRTAARMAGAFHGHFTALFIETPSFEVMPDKEKDSLRSNIHLAQQLGASIESVYGADIPTQIAEFARIFGVTKIVMGRSGARRKYLWSKPSLSEQLTLAAPNLDIHIIPDGNAASYRPTYIRDKSRQSSKFLIKDLFKSLGLLILATLVSFVFYRLGFSEANIITVYILSVLVTAVLTSSRVFSVISSVVSVVMFNFFFTIPRFTLSAYDTGYPATFLIMFGAAFLTGTLAVRLKTQVHRSAQTAYRTKLLLETNQLLQSGQTSRATGDIAAAQLAKLVMRTVIFYSFENGKLADPIVYEMPNTAPQSGLISENEQAVAAWVCTNNKRAGAFTNTLGSSKCLYHAVRAKGKVFGVVGVALMGKPLDTFENNILLSILGECGLALESLASKKEKEEAAMLVKSEQLRANLLRSISHDLRTPLTAISGSASVLMESGEKLTATERHQLSSNIYDDSVWLINLVENLLAVTKIEDGTMSLRTSAELVREVVDEALRHVNRKTLNHHIEVRELSELLLAQMEAKLIIQVIINLVDNAIKYTPSGSSIIITISKVGAHAAISVSDNGLGIEDQAKAHIFDMFYTLNNKIADSRRSLGLGLALCKSIVIAHGGEITIKDNDQGGAMFTFTLPIKEVS